VGERRVAEALRARAGEPDPAAGRQEPGDPPAEPAERERDQQDQERAREPEDEFSDRWHSYRERANHLHQPPTVATWLARPRSPSPSGGAPVVHG
jgi:hypothetical protein